MCVPVVAAQAVAKLHKVFVSFGRSEMRMDQLTAVGEAIADAERSIFGDSRTHDKAALDDELVQSMAKSAISMAAGLRSGGGDGDGGNSQVADGPETKAGTQADDDKPLLPPDKSKGRQRRVSRQKRAPDHVRVMREASRSSRALQSAPPLSAVVAPCASSSDWPWLGPSLVWSIMAL